jgi:hypothetical protein
MGVGSASVVDYANTYPGTASHVNATGSVGDFEVVVDGSGATTLSLNFQTATSLDPRITFSRSSNATLVGPDGLVQYAPHNLLTYSEQFDNAAWTKTNATVSANVTTAPDGTSTADKLVENTAAGAHSTLEGYSFATTTYTYSVYAKAGERTKVRFVAATGSGGVLVDVNLITGSVSASSAFGTGFAVVGATVTSIGTGWYRAGLIFSSTAGSGSVQAILLDASGSNSYTGDGVSGIYIWGAQLNEGALQPYYSTTVKNLLGYSQNFENSAWTKSNSSIAASTVIGPFGFDGGEKLVENTTASVGHYIQPIPSPSFTVGQVLTYSVYTKAAERTFLQLILTGVGSGGANLVAGFDIVNGIAGTPNAGTSTIVPIGNGWFRCSFTVSVLTAATTGAQIRLSTNSSNTPSSYTGDGTSGIYIFGAQLSDSASLDPYSYNPVAVPTSTAYYGPRFDYDPATLAPKGLLIEEQRTNLMTYSSEFDNAAWTKSGTPANILVNTNVAIAPDGTTTADKIIDNTTTAQHLIYEVYATTLGQTYTYSIYAKMTSPAEWTVFRLQLGSGGGIGIFDLAAVTASIANANAIAASITSVGNGWFRCSLVATSNGNGNNYIYKTGGTYAGDGTSGIYIWGAQLEAGAFPTSYIPTTSATVTRAADNASMLGSNFSSWYNQSEGTIYAAVSFTNTSSFNTVYSITDGTTNNAIRTIQWNNGTDRPLIITTAGLGQTAYSATGLIGDVKYCAAFTLNNANYAKNGVLGVDDTLVTLPTVNQLSFGSTAGSTFYLTGHIQSIKYYPTRLPNGTLQGLTT